MTVEDHRKALEAKHGQVWDTKQLQEDFTVRHFGFGVAFVTRKKDKVPGTIDFQHMPRFYFDFRGDV